MMGSTESKCSSVITVADKEGILKSLRLTDLLLVLPIEEYSILPKPCLSFGEGSAQYRYINTLDFSTKIS